MVMLMGLGEEMLDLELRRYGFHSKFRHGLIYFFAKSQSLILIISYKIKITAPSPHMVVTHPSARDRTPLPPPWLSVTLAEWEGDVT